MLKASVSVEKTRYRKDDFAIYIFSINRLKDGSDKPMTDSMGYITVKGTFPVLQEDGSQYNLVGEYIKDPQWGDQYNVVSICSDIEFGINDPRGKKQFLSSIFTPYQVQSMYEALDDPFEALKNEDVDKLIKIKGCSINRAIVWSDRFKTNYHMAKIFTELEEYELTNNMINKLLDKYKSPDLVIHKVKTNPYILATEIRGIGFKKADKIALAGGLDKYSIERISGFILYYLEEMGEEGLSWITADHLMGAVLENLGEDIPDIKVGEAIRSLGESNKVWWNEDKTQIGLMRYYDIERKIAEELIRLRDAKSNIPYNSNWKDSVKELEIIQGWEFTDEQMDGIKTGLESNVTIITGLSGSGKTSVVKGIIKVYNGIEFIQVALSGRAASRLTEVTGQEGATIHRTLGYPKGPANKGGFLYNDENQLDKDLYILDEISMVDSFLFYDLLRAIPTGSKIYLLGDVGQLESIGAGNIAHDMIQSGEIPTVYLTKIHRQAAKSAIVTESIKVRNGEYLTEKDWVGTETRGELKDLTLQCYSDASNTYHKIIETFKQYMQRDDFDIMETQIIVPVKARGDACTTKLNHAIQEIVNPHNGQHFEKVRRDGVEYELRVGDKVINRQNNYKTCPFIYNGNMGILKRYDWDEDLEEDVMIIDFKAIGIVKVPKRFWSAIDLAYAITVHSDQGSEHDNVIFGFDNSSYTLLTRELVYTGITRARKKCELIAQSRALGTAIKNMGLSKKQTHLVRCIDEVAHPKIVF